MYRRQICPSVGAILRPLTHDTAALPRPQIRSFHISARRCEENGNSSPSAPKPDAPMETRRTRSRAAVGQVLSLGSKPNSSSATGSPQVAGRPLIRRVDYGQDGPNPSATPRSAPPPGKMVRAPAQLRITRNARGPRPKGPGLGKPKGEEGRGGDPKRRQRPAGGGGGAGMPLAQPSVEDTLTDGMVQLLLRLQRKEWDRVKYEPKYAHGSKAAQELIEAGKKLFQGDPPKVKKPGRLEYTIGIQNMHGA